MKINMGLNTTALTNAQNSAASNLYTNITHIGVGTDNTAFDVAQTALVAETDRNALFGQLLSDNVVRKDVRFDETENNDNTVREIGTFNAASSGTMYTRNLTNPALKTANKAFFYRLKTTFVAENN